MKKWNNPELKNLNVTNTNEEGIIPCPADSMESTDSYRLDNSKKCKVWNCWHGESKKHNNGYCGCHQYLAGGGNGGNAGDNDSTTPPTLPLS